MIRTLARAALRLNRWIVSLRQERIPQLLLVVEGAISVGTGAIFLARPDTFHTSRALSDLVGFVPPAVWGASFLVLGAWLATNSFNDHRAVVTVTGAWLFSVIMTVFCLLTAASAITGQGTTGLTALWALGFAAIGTLAALAATAPETVRLLEKYADEPAAPQRSHDA
jgi:hypothetical protein